MQEVPTHLQRLRRVQNKQEVMICLWTFPLQLWWRRHTHLASPVQERRIPSKRRRGKHRDREDDLRLDRGNRRSPRARRAAENPPPPPPRSSRARPGHSPTSCSLPGTAHDTASQGKERGSVHEDSGERQNDRTCKSIVIILDSTASSRPCGCSIARKGAQTSRSLYQNPQSSSCRHVL